MHFKEFLEKSAIEINTELESYFTNWNKYITHISPRLKPLGNALKEASSGGKRIRGALVLLGFLISGKPVANKQQELLRIAAAYEIFQTAILAHDDIIDKSPVRRGQPSLHNRLGNDHYGMSQAICLGDIGFFLAYKIITESNFPDKEKNKALSYFSQAIHETVIGQMLDVDVAQGIIGVEEKDVLEVARLKTAYYTFVGPLTLGAVLGGADERTLEAIKKYGEHTGIAFQLQDDIQDIFGNPESLKKEVGGDIKERKQTILLIRAKENANKKQLAQLQSLYGNQNISSQEIETVKQIFIDTGALSYTEKLAASQSAKAGASIKQITKEQESQELLREIIQFVNHEK